MALQAMCSATTATGDACPRPVHRDTGLCWHHAAMRAIGPGDTGKRPQWRACTARNLATGDPCGGWVAYRVPDADYHALCIIHYYAHLRDRDRTVSQGCGCVESGTPRRRPGRPRKAQA